MVQASAGFTVVVTNRVRLVAGLGQLDLLLAVDGAATGFLAQLVPAMRATDTRLIVLGLAVLDADRCTAGMALIVVAFAQVMAHGHAVIEHKAVALPFGFFLGHLFEVFQDAALEVIHLVKTFAEHIARGLFTTNAAGAEHRDFLVLGRVEVGFDIVGKFAKTGGFRVDSAFKGADRHFVVVAGVDQQHFWIADQRVPVLGVDVGTDFLVRVDAFNPRVTISFLSLTLVR
jgi:hypothetical protein